MNKACSPIDEQQIKKKPCKLGFYFNIFTTQSVFILAHVLPQIAIFSIDFQLLNHGLYLVLTQRAANSIYPIKGIRRFKWLTALFPLVYRLLSLNPCEIFQILGERFYFDIFYKTI